MDQDSAHMVAASKVLMLKPGEYKIWRMRIEQYIQMIDYALWEVIENEGDFVDLQLNDIEDMLFLVVQHFIPNSTEVTFLDLNCGPTHVPQEVLIIKRQVEDLQLGVESYQKKLNITEPQKTFIGIEFKELYTPSYKLPRAIYKDLNKHKRVMQADELYKFLDETLKTVRDELHHRILNFRLRYNKKMSRRKWTAIDKRNSGLMVKLIDKKMRERRIKHYIYLLGNSRWTTD
ncbi:hypothetical protein Tco_0017450 [Tanacetum coccineum]